MLDLERLVAAIGALDVVGRAQVDVEELAYSTDGVGPGTLFFCVPGARVDGHDFAGEAVAKGAVALVTMFSIVLYTVIAAVERRVLDRFADIRA